MTDFAPLIRWRDALALDWHGEELVSHVADSLPRMDESRVPEEHRPAFREFSLLPEDERYEIIRKVLGFTEAQPNGVKTGQVWIYERDGCGPVVHVISKVDGEVCESTSVFSSDGKAHERCVISGAGCGGVGIQYMLDGRDKVGTWRRLA